MTVTLQRLAEEMAEDNSKRPPQVLCHSHHCLACYDDAGHLCIFEAAKSPFLALVPQKACAAGLLQTNVWTVLAGTFQPHGHSIPAQTSDGR